MEGDYMLRLMKVLSSALILSLAACDTLDANLGDAANEEDSSDNKSGNGDKQGTSDCAPNGRLYCVETAPGVFESKTNTLDAQCHIVKPEGKIVDLSLCEQHHACTDDAMMVCRQLSPGIYIETGVGREGPKCEFPTDGVVDASFCEGTTDLDELIANLQEKDGQQVSVTGSNRDWRNEPQPACAEITPAVGEPTLSTTYLADRRAFGIKNNTHAMKAAFSADDARTMSDEFIGTINEESTITLHGVFKYKTVVPICGDGSIVHPSGVIELDLMKK